VQDWTDRTGKEASSADIWTMFQDTYLAETRLALGEYRTAPDPVGRRMTATVRASGQERVIEGVGSGPIDAFVDALKKAFKVEFSFIDYHEHAVGRGANATAASYVEIQDGEGRSLHGVGMDPNIVMASLKATLGAVLRLMRREGRAL